MDELTFPRLVYKAGGPWALESGNFSVREVAAAADLDALHAEGWRLDQYAAKEAGAEVQAEAPQESAAAGDPLTREQLEAKAKALGIDFDGRTSDRKLAARIALAKG